MKPRYEHDCDACRFLRRVDGYDIYVCYDTAIARYGDKAESYISLRLKYLKRCLKQFGHELAEDLTPEELAITVALALEGIASLPDVPVHSL